MSHYQPPILLKVVFILAFPPSLLDFWPFQVPAVSLALGWDLRLCFGLSPSFREGVILSFCGARTQLAFPLWEEGSILWLLFTFDNFVHTRNTERDRSSWASRRGTDQWITARESEGAPGWHSRLRLWLLVLPGVVILGLWDEPCVGLRALCRVCLGLSVPLPLPPTAHLYNKWMNLFKKLKKCKDMTPSRWLHMFFLTSVPLTEDPKQFIDNTLLRKSSSLGVRLKQPLDNRDQEEQH